MKYYCCDRCGYSFKRIGHLISHYYKKTICKKNINKTLKYQNKSPLRYIGDKYYNFNVLDSIINSKINIKNYDTLLVPFYEKGSIELLMQSKYQLKIIANAKCYYAYCFWKSCKYDNINLYHFLKNIPQKLNQKKYIYLKNILYKSDNYFNIAFYYYRLNRSSHSGDIFNHGYGHNILSKNRKSIKNINIIKNLNLKDNFFIYNNNDIYTFLHNHYDINDKKTLIFLYPDNFVSTKVSNFSHEQLYNYLKTKINWILIYNDSEYIKELYKDFIIISGCIGRSWLKYKKNIYNKYETIIFYIKKTL